MKEIWKPIVGYGGHYEISSLGNLRKYKDGYFLYITKSIDHKGYHRVCLCFNSMQKTYPLHRLVAKAFIPNPLNKPQVNHLNCNKIDNQISNLEWCTQTENRNHALANNICKTGKGELNMKAKLTLKKVIEMRELYKTGNFRYKQIAKIYGVSPASAREAILGIYWK